MTKHKKVTKQDLIGKCFKHSSGLVIYVTDVGSPCEAACSSLDGGKQCFGSPCSGVVLRTPVWYSSLPSITKPYPPEYIAFEFRTDWCCANRQAFAKIKPEDIK